MPRTLDLFTLQLALIQRATVVGTEIVDRIKLAVDVAHGYVMISNTVDRDIFGRNVSSRSNALPGRHRRACSSLNADQIRSSMDGSARRDKVDWKNPSTMSCSAVERSSPRDCR